MTTKKWAVTKSGLGIVGFSTKAVALAAVPDSVPVRCDFGGLSGCGWLAMDRHSTENNGTFTTPDGRVISGVVWGYCDWGCLIGIRGWEPKESFRNEWSAIMLRCINVGLAVAKYQQA